MSGFHLFLGLVIMANAFVCLYRAAIGPTLPDRILAVNIVGTKTLVLLALIAFIFRQTLYLDVALVYALLNFIVTTIAARYMETGKIRGDWER